MWTQKSFKLLLTHAYPTIYWTTKILKTPNFSDPKFFCPEMFWPNKFFSAKKKYVDPKII